MNKIGKMMFQNYSKELQNPLFIWYMNPGSTTRRSS